MENPTECLPHPQALLKDRDTPQGKRSDILSKGKISKSIITHIRVNQIILKNKNKKGIGDTTDMGSSDGFIQSNNKIILNPSSWEKHTFNLDYNKENQVL